MKKVILIWFVTVGLCLSLSTSVWAAPKVTLNGQQLSFEVPPVIDNGRTLVPLRAIFEAMGATVTWDQENMAATAIKGDTKVLLKVGSTTPTINGQVSQLDVPAQVVDNRILAPLRFVGEAFGGSVQWDQRTETVIIGTKQIIISDSNPNYGKIIFPDGGLYEGEIKDGLRDGQGTQKWITGDEYAGGWKQDLMNGEGTGTWANGGKYVGTWVNGNRSGKGVMTYGNGGKYDGNWMNDSRNGSGCYTWPNGDKYTGGWVDDYCTGQGMCIWTDGDKYLGEFKENIKSGQGTYTFANGDRYSGAWANDKPNGYGTYTWKANGGRYVGNWVNGIRDGEGAYYTSSGILYNQKYSNGVLVQNPTSTTTYTPTYTPPTYVPSYTPPTYVPIYTPSYVPIVTGGVIESRIDGEFEGFDGDTIFTLMNGQIWQQSSYHYHYHYAYMPKVLIYPSYGRYKMHVEGVNTDIYVVRLR
ncbi:MAG: hypothetical protein GYA42_06420 [Syntrophomonadaceae bacterium]|nr:hypothetical protein [Syntrophomonadaceae bacterium]